MYFATSHIKFNNIISFETKKSNIKLISQNKNPELLEEMEQS